VRSGIKHQTSNNSRDDEGSSSNNNDGDGPCWQKWANIDLSSLGSVREVVVSAGHVVESSSLVHLDETSIEVSWGSIEFHAVLNVGFNIVLVVVVLGQQLSVSQTVGLSQHGHVKSQLLSFEEGSVRIDPRVRSGLHVSKTGKLHHVGSIGLGGSLTSISSWVGVASGPLEVNKVVCSSFEALWHEVVFSGGVSLNDVSSLSSNVEVEDSLSSGNSRGSGQEVEDIRSVLEGSSELRSIGGKLESSCVEGISLSDNGFGSVSVEDG